MRFPLPSRSFSRRHHEKGKKNETLWQGSFQILQDETTDSFGDFPRRVQLGDVLGITPTHKILSSANGIVEQLKENNQNYFKLTQDGSLESKHNFIEPKLDANGFLNLIEKNGVYSLDYHKTALWNYLTEFAKGEENELVLSSHTNRISPNFTKILQSDYPNEVANLDNFLSSIFPNKKIHNFLDPTKNKITGRYKYPLGIPDYFLQKELQKNIYGIDKSDKGRIFFLGGETIWHLIRCLYYDIPFTKRHLAIECVDGNGRIDGRERYFLISNGQSFRFLDKIFFKKYKYLSLNSFDQPSRIMKRSDEYFYNIYEEGHLILSVNHPRQNRELPCTECNDCDAICPTQADPQALIHNRSEFYIESCIECGLCTFYCPSGIDFRSKIKDLKYPNIEQTNKGLTANA
ncbi:MAG: 4Fe-4S dicluster domain-containing protein [Leptospira sp.]|nr:4Fe-4S dicluster domain-containing protein [Leptospira sp.]NCS94832.1 4Fe-4S dicluster domain-containing protein [Leptospira sp.]